MAVLLDIRNVSVRKRIARRDRLVRLAERVCSGESVAGDIEISLFLCDDPDIAELNRRFGGDSGPTDVLSFEQEGRPVASPRPLGDVVISAETAERNCGGDRALLRAEIELLFCHGLLHLLGYDHQSARDRGRMQQKQAEYLGLSERAAWEFGPKHAAAPPAPALGGTRRIGR